MSEQMFQLFITENDCPCPSSTKQPDCSCFTKPNKKIPLRISPGQKMFSRLWFLNNNAQSKNLDTNLRLREARLYLKQSSDPIVNRYGKLWQKKTLNFAKEADSEILKIADRLQLEVLQPQTTLTQETNRLMVDDDDDDVENPSFTFANQQAQGRETPYDIEENSAKQQLLNYNSQSDAHFQERVYNMINYINMLWHCLNTLQ